MAAVPSHRFQSSVSGRVLLRLPADHRHSPSFVRPSVHLADFADHAALNHRDGLTVGDWEWTWMPICVGKPSFLGDQPKLPRFEHFVRQWFLTIHRFVKIQRRHRSGRVRMIGRRNHNCVDF